MMPPRRMLSERASRFSSRVGHALIGAGILAVAAVTAVWAFRFLERKPTAGAVGAVSALLALRSGYVPLFGAFTLVAITLVVRPELNTRRTLAWATGLLVAVVGAGMSWSHGHHVAIVALALYGAIVLTIVPLPLLTPPGDRVLAAMTFAVAAPLHAFFSMHRFHWFGAGSWDLGCMVHNLYRSSRFLDTTSTVLGDVDFLGDHFMIGLYLFAPLAWIDSSAYMMLAIQAISLGAIAPAIFVLARDKGAGKAAATILGLCAGLAFGVQSAAYFDSHEIAIAIGFLAWGIVHFERAQYARATILFVLFMLFKESLGAYLVALGLLAIIRALFRRDRRLLRFGAAWFAGGLVWFVLVNRVFMPALIARANRPEPHETFGDFGPTIFLALLGILRHPVEAFAAMFVPAEKVSSMLVTFGGLGFLAFAAPEIAIAAVPLFAERFLSSKTSMWEMGYHYAAPLSLYAAWAVAIAWPRCVSSANRALAHLGGTRLSLRGEPALVFYILISTLAINAAGYRHPSNYHRLREDYFSTPERRTANSNAVQLIEGAGREARVAAQNRILPHLADRPHIWRLGEWKKADWVVLNIAESAWPYDDAMPRRLTASLGRDPAWRLVFAEGETAVFARTASTTLPTSTASPPIQALIPGSDPG